jgi:ArsR family transcriptional regulator, arsenate/arsenite/antimonite-responsive transcriptional repressor / arsenate reductase (thioredoxin)
MAPSGTGAPPEFVRLAAHPLRWSILTALADGDHRVREIVQLVGEPQSLVSYHLRLLRVAGLVTTTRSSFDGRDTYYHLDLARCSAALAATGAVLHPALLRDDGHPVRADVRRPGRPSVLFVCTGNSARSPIAEALLRHHAADRVTVASAGTRPRDQVHPHAVRVLSESFGIDIAGQRPQSIDGLLRRRFDHVITLCDRARESCPDFRHPPRRTHWSIPDPAATAGDSDATGRAVFLRTAADLDTRVRHLLPVLDTTHDRGGST